MSGALQRASFWNLPAAELAAHVQERRREAATAVVPFVRPSAAGNAPAVYRPRRSTSYRGYDDFMPAFRAAREAAAAKHGPNWWMKPDASRWARVPPTWVAWKGYSRSGSSPRDMHFPVGEFWPGGVLPIGPEYAAPVSVAQFAERPPRPRATIDAPAWEWLADAAD